MTDRLDDRERRIFNAIRRAIRQDKDGQFLKYGLDRRESNNVYAGYCYVASEAFIHLIRRKGYKPMCMKVEVKTGTMYDMLYRTFMTHWFVQAPDGRIIDPTAEQFGGKIRYDYARGKGFLTKKPSKRAAALIKEVRKLL